MNLCNSDETGKHPDLGGPVGYYIRFLPKKKQHPFWKVQFVSAKKSDQRKSTTAKNPRRAWDISKERWSSLGFNPSMTIQEAQVRARQLNANLQLKRQELRIKCIQEKQNTFHLQNTASLPEEFVSEFEDRFIRPRKDLPIKKYKTRHHNRYTAWKAAQKIIVAIGIEPTNWFFHQERFYDLFHQKQFSIGYIHKIITMLNLWGFYITRKFGQPFYPVLKPRGYEMQRLLEAYYKKVAGRRRPSLPITPEQLNIISRKINTLNPNPNLNRVKALFRKF